MKREKKILVNFIATRSGPRRAKSMQIRIWNIDSCPLFLRCDPVAVHNRVAELLPGVRLQIRREEEWDPSAFHHVSCGQVQARETPAGGQPQVWILQHFTMCLAAKFRLEKCQPRGNLSYRACSISRRVSRPSSGWRNASRGATSGIDPATFHHMSRGQVQAGETPAGGQPQV